MVDVIDFLAEHMNKHKVEWKIVDAPVDVYYCGIGVAKGNEPALKDWLNVAIYELHRSGASTSSGRSGSAAPMLHDPSAGSDSLLTF